MKYRICIRSVLIVISVLSCGTHAAIRDVSFVEHADQGISSKLRVPAGFGKTHFIAGFPHGSVTHVSKQENQHESLTTGNKTVLFSPDDNLQQALINLIRNESKSIKIAIYTFTDKDIAQALIDAHKRGVKVQMITDPSQVKDRYSKCSLLQKAGIKVFEYNPNYIKDMRSNLMHHKFAIFGCEPYQDCCVWTGSFNFTQAACKRNQENALIVKDVHIVDKFSTQFELLKKRCHNYSAR